MDIQNPDPGTPSGPGNGTPSTPATPTNNYGPMPHETPGPITPIPSPTPSPRGRPSQNPAPPGSGTPAPTPDPTPSTPDPTTQISPVPIFQQGPQRTDVYVSAANTPLPIIYGQQRIGAQIWYRKVQPDNTELVLYAISHGPINSISNIQVEGKPIGQFCNQFEIFTGTSGQGLSVIG